MSQYEIISQDLSEQAAAEKQVGGLRPELASMFKVGCHKERVRAYLDGKGIFPITLELDLTSECTRVCPECPSATAANHHSLNKEFVDRLFGCLEGHTTGLLLTGGEPTMAPLFPRALQMARQRGFIDIAVVTNGSLLNSPPVEEALLAYVTTIRLSMYDWDRGSCEGVEWALRRIESLRKRIDCEGSRLQIGISALTSRSRAGMLGKLTESVLAAGAHWIYFHPLCTKWGIGCPEPAEQEGILTKINVLQEKDSGNCHVFTFRARYEHTPLEFNGYHAAHFLLVIGADGKNYLGPEVKYQSHHVMADPGVRWRDDFLWEEQRLARVNSVNSRTYPAIQSRHRGVLYNHFIEQLKRGEEPALTELERASVTDFFFPHIL
jgi:MoaA/NifB/PqqE/SkfB family radical SAM enzyme